MSNQKYSLASALSLLLLVPTWGSAQQFTDEQMEVWDFIVECNEAFDDEDVDDVLDCYHDDFTGWLYGDNVPRTKAASEIFIPTYFDLEEPLAYELRPISIWVEGDFAFAHYFLRLTYRDANGQVVDERQNWTDILLREDGDWFWVGDHGGVVTNRP